MTPLDEREATSPGRPDASHWTVEPDAAVRSGYAFSRYDERVDRTVSFRPATMERDLGRLHAWLGYDHVQSYWDLDEPLLSFRDELAAKLADDHLTPYVGFLDHVPMSYFEVYWPSEDPLASHYDARPTDRGVHLLIGPPEYIGEGYAKALVRALGVMQFADPETDRVVLEPDVRNDVVVHVLETCGFEREKTFHFPAEDKDAALMVTDRERFANAVLGDTAEIPAGVER